MGMTLNLEFLKNIKLPTIGAKGSRTSSVCFYSPSTFTTYEYSKQTIKPVSTPTKDSSLISFIPLDDIIGETLEMSRFLNGQELYEAIELKLFDELALEPSFEYKICYEALPDAEDNSETKRYNAYVANYHAIRQRLAGISDRYVEFVFTPQTVIKTLFTKNFLSDSATFAFIYLYNDNAYLCVYQNGSFTYSKSIRGSIRTLTERFSEILGERVDSDDFIKILVNSDFRAKKPEYAAGFKTLIAEFFTAISDILVHAKRINQISGYEAIYIATEHGNIADITETAKEYFETPFRDFDFNLGIRTEGFVDMSAKLMIFAYLNDMDAYEHLNFSIFLRPPPLLQRPAGKFMGISTIALIVTCAYPLYNFTLANLYASYKIKSLNAELAPLLKEKEMVYARQDNAEKIAANMAKNFQIEEQKYSDTLTLLREIEKAKTDIAGITGHIIKTADATAHSNVRIAELSITYDVQKQKIEGLENKRNSLIDSKTNAESYISILTKEAASLKQKLSGMQNESEKNETASKLKIIEDQLKKKQDEKPKIALDIQTAEMQLKIDKEKILQSEQKGDLKSILMKLVCVSHKAADITDFTKKLSKVDNYIITVDKISKDGNASTYIGEITAAKGQR
jgi:hypothetical protein